MSANNNKPAPSFNGLTAKDIADWLALNPDNVEVTKALAMCFTPIVCKGHTNGFGKGTIGFDTGMLVGEVFSSEDSFEEFCEAHDNSTRYY